MKRQCHKKISKQMFPSFISNTTKLEKPTFPSAGK